MSHRPLPDHIATYVDELSTSLKSFSPEDVFGLVYEHQIGRVFSQISLVESTIVDALWMCKNVRLVGESNLKSATDRIVWRKSVLQDQTFGNLIQVLSRNGVSDPSLAYFRFLKRMRDRFVHRFFEDHVFPGELLAWHFVRHIRDLRCFELLFWRATDKIWRILGREKYDQVRDLGPHGVLLWNNFDESPDRSDGG